MVTKEGACTSLLATTGRGLVTDRFWTPERQETLRKLWNQEGLSATQIAKEMGCFGHCQDGGRSAVLGEVRRMKLKKRGRGTSKPPQQKKEKVPTISRTAKMAGVTDFNNKPWGRAAIERPPPVAPTLPETLMEALPAVVSNNVVIPVSRYLKLVQLREGDCKWPNGDPLTEDFNFCGNETDSGQYCTYHARIAFVPASERRRAYR